MRSKALIILTGGLGDALISVPIFNIIRQRHPDDELHLLYENKPGRTPSIEAIKHLELFDAYIPANFNKQNKIPYKSLWKLRGDIRKESYSDAYYITSCTRSSKTIARDKWFFKASGIKTLHGFNPIDSILLFPQSKNAEPEKGHHELYWRIKRLYLKNSESSKELINEIHYPIPDCAKEELKSLIDTPKPIATIMPSSSNPAKDWSARRFAAVAKHLEALNYTVVCAGDATQEQACQYVLKATEEGINMAGKLSFLGSAALLENSALFIGLDSSLAHLSGILGTPSIILFSGQSHPGQWYPISKNNNITLLTHMTECAGCFKAVCPFERHPCMRKIATEKVIAAINDSCKKDKPPQKTR